MSRHWYAVEGSGPHFAGLRREEVLAVSPKVAARRYAEAACLEHCGKGRIDVVVMRNTDTGEQVGQTYRLNVELETRAVVTEALEERP